MEEQNNNLFVGNNYDMPEDRDEFVDMKTGEVIDKEKIDPMDVIRKIAEKTGTKIQDPKKNCKKCWGRGYTARDAETKAPIPCKCIYPKLEGEELKQQQEMENRMRPLTRNERRMLKRQAEKAAKKQKRREWKAKRNKK